MEIGSVKFWRHVIVGCVVGLIALFMLLALIFGVRTFLLTNEVGELQEKNEQLNLEAAEALRNQEEAASADGDSSSGTDGTGDGEILGYQLLYPDMQVDYTPKTDDNTQKIVYLTFDDGPSKETTPQILDILDEYGAKATFFVSGQYGTKEYRGQMYNEILDRGNALGLHTYTHDYRQIYSSVEAYLDDLYEIYSEVYEATGYQPDMIRFPGGSINSYNGSYFYQLIGEVTRRGFTYHDWVVDSTDALSGVNNKVAASTLVDTVLSGCEGRTKIVVLFHDNDTKSTTVEALPTVLEELQSQGYEFRALDSSVNPFHSVYPDQP
jgi:peptidoglycan/xylan/chitin deacetylase (PgdA/CDA1 family)